MGSCRLQHVSMTCAQHAKYLDSHESVLACMQAHNHIIESHEMDRKARNAVAHAPTHLLTYKFQETSRDLLLHVRFIRHQTITLGQSSCFVGIKMNPLDRSITSEEIANDVNGRCR
jgi:hypothetical protein